MLRRNTTLRAKLSDKALKIVVFIFNPSELEQGFIANHGDFDDAAQQMLPKTIRTQDRDKRSSHLIVLFQALPRTSTVPPQSAGGTHFVGVKKVAWTDGLRNVAYRWKHNGNNAHLNGRRMNNGGLRQLAMLYAKLSAPSQKARTLTDSVRVKRRLDAVGSMNVVAE